MVIATPFVVVGLATCAHREAPVLRAHRYHYVRIVSGKYRSPAIRVVPPIVRIDTIVHCDSTQVSHDLERWYTVSSDFDVIRRGQPWEFRRMKSAWRRGGCCGGCGEPDSVTFNGPFWVFEDDGYTHQLRLTPREAAWLKRMVNSER